MRNISLLFLFALFFIKPSNISALEIQEGYWLGMSIPNHASHREGILQEWHFDGNRLTYQKYNLNLEAGQDFILGRYQLEDNKLSLRDPAGNERSSISASFQGETLILEYEELYRTVYLYYNGLESSKPLESPLGIHFKEQLFSTNQAHLFYDSEEIEFWDFASFYDKNDLATCHHEYQFIRFGKYDFIYFDRLDSFRIISHENDHFIIEKLKTDGLEAFELKAIDNLGELLAEHLVGDWSWKKTKHKPRNEKNVYTISIGYDIHKLIIDDSLNIQWLTKIGSSGLIENDSKFLGDKIHGFQSQYARKRKINEVPNIRFSPSGRLITFEGFSKISVPGNGENDYYSGVRILQYLEKSDIKLFFKTPYTTGTYITLTKAN